MNFCKTQTNTKRELKERERERRERERREGEKRKRKKEKRERMLSTSLPSACGFLRWQVFFPLTRLRSWGLLIAGTAPFRFGWSHLLRIQDWMMSSIFQASSASRLYIKYITYIRCFVINFNLTSYLCWKAKFGVPLHGGLYHSNIYLNTRPSRHSPLLAQQLLEVLEQDDWRDEAEERLYEAALARFQTDYRKYHAHLFDLVPLVKPPWTLT